MRRSLYKALMNTLDAAIDNGYEEEMEAMSPEQIYADILVQTGERTWEEVPSDDLYSAIRGWQERTFG